MTASTQRDDWFTYVYQIDNIDELIRTHEHSQSFVQSPLFSFTNHIVTTPGNNSNNSTPPTTPTAPLSANGGGGGGGSSPTSNQLTSTNLNTPVQGNNVNNSFFTNPPVNNAAAAAASTTTQLSPPPTPVLGMSTTQPIPTSVSSLSTNSTPVSEAGQNKSAAASMWRLIFYPNGAGADCKNFLSIFLKYMSDEPVKIQMMFSIVDNRGDDVYVKYTVNRFSKSNDWGFKQLIHKNAILYQRDKFLKANGGGGVGSGALSIKIKMRLDEHRHDYIKKLNDNLHYCKLLSDNFSQYYYNNNSGAAAAAVANSSSGSSSQTVEVSNDSSLSNAASSTSCVSIGPVYTAAAATTSGLVLSTNSSTSSMFTREVNNNNNNNSASYSQPCSTSTTIRPSMSINSGLTGLTLHNAVVSKLATVSSSSPALSGGTTTSAAASACNSAYYDVVLLVKCTPESGEFEDGVIKSAASAASSSSSSFADKKSASGPLCFECSNKFGDTSTTSPLNKAYSNPNTPRYVFFNLKIKKLIKLDSIHYLENFSSDSTFFFNIYF
jgi:hypothetical protein